MNISYNEFHISKTVRDACKFPLPLYASTGNVILADLKAVRAFAVKLNAYLEKIGEPENKRISAGTLNAMGLLDEIFHFAAMMYRKTKYPNAMTELMSDLDEAYGAENIDRLLLEFTAEFPPTEVYQGKISAEDYLKQTAFDIGANRERTNREATSLRTHRQYTSDPQHCRWPSHGQRVCAPHRRVSGRAFLQASSSPQSYVPLPYRHRNNAEADHRPS